MARLRDGGCRLTAFTLNRSFHTGTTLSLLLTAMHLKTHHSCRYSGCQMFGVSTLGYGFRGNACLCHGLFNVLHHAEMFDSVADGSVHHFHEPR